MVLVLYFVVVVRECDSCFGGVHVTALVWYFVITVRLRLVRGKQWNGWFRRSACGSCLVFRSGRPRM